MEKATEDTHAEGPLVYFSAKFAELCSIHTTGRTHNVGLELVPADF